MLGINLKGKKAVVAGIGDDQGFGWAIAKILAEAGAEIIVGTWTPLLKIFTQALKAGKFDESRKLSDGSLMQFAGIYPLDAAFDTLDEVPEDIRENKRYKSVEGYTVSDFAKIMERDFGTIDILVHSLANGPEVKNDLLDTSRQGYLAAMSASSYSLISLVRHLGPIMNSGGSVISLTFMGSERCVPGYGGGMSSAKAALESDTKILAWEAAKKWNIRINSVSAGALRSRAGRAIGFIDNMIRYSEANAPLERDLKATDVGNACAFLLSPLAASITGTILYVDNGMHVMGIAPDSVSLNATEMAGAVG
jgi:enoyl-[acyl-carrier protein] reductase I